MANLTDSLRETLLEGASTEVLGPAATWRFSMMAVRQRLGWSFFARPDSQSEPERSAKKRAGEPKNVVYAEEAFYEWVRAEVGPERLKDEGRRAGRNRRESKELMAGSARQFVWRRGDENPHHAQGCDDGCELGESAQ